MTTTQVSATMVTPQASSDLRKPFASISFRAWRPVQAKKGMESLRPAISAASLSNSAADRCGLPMATASIWSVRSVVARRRWVSVNMSALTCDRLAQRSAAGRGFHIRRFRRHAQNMKQPDAAGRGRRRAEGFQRVLARMRRDAGDDADRSPGEPPEQAAQNRKGDLAGQQRGGQGGDIDGECGAPVLLQMQPIIRRAAAEMAQAMSRKSP